VTWGHTARVIFLSLPAHSESEEATHEQSHLALAVCTGSGKEIWMLPEFGRQLPPCRLCDLPCSLRWSSQQKGRDERNPSSIEMLWGPSELRHSKKPRKVPGSSQSSGFTLIIASIRI
jgi:hypothetical protein